jgi:hypothetical protein
MSRLTERIPDRKNIPFSDNDMNRATGQLHGPEKFIQGRVEELPVRAGPGDKR